jgi:hypothetical protein
MPGRLNGRALLISALAGTVIDLSAIYITGTLLPAAFTASGAGVASFNLAMLGRNTCGGPILIAAGLLYCYLHSRSALLRRPGALLGGAAAGALVGLLSRVVEAGMLLAAGLELLPPGVPTAGVMLALAAGAGTCLSVAAGAALGLGGGLIGLLLFRPRTG